MAIILGMCRPCSELPKRTLIMRLLKKGTCLNVFCKNWKFSKWWFENE